MKRNSDPEMTDKERILTAIVRELSTTQILARKVNLTFSAADFERGFGDRGHYAHFAAYRQPVVGDLVLCNSSGLHPWTIGWYVEQEPRGHATATIREIGTERLCNMSNESFYPIVGMSPLDMLEGEQHRFYAKVTRAFWKADEYFYRFGGLDFPEKRRAIIWVREAFGGHLGEREESVPFAVETTFTVRTSIDRIVRTLREGGLGTRKFERQERETREAIE